MTTPTPVPTIRMRSTQLGSPDGHAVHRYEAGATYSGETQPPMSADLAAVFVREGWAIYADIETQLEAMPEPPKPTARRQRRPGPTERKAG